MKSILMTIMTLISCITSNFVSTPIDYETTVEASVMQLVENQHIYDVGNLASFAVSNNNIYYINGDLNQIGTDKYEVINKQLNVYNKQSNNSTTLSSYTDVETIKQSKNYVGLLSNDKITLFKDGKKVEVEFLDTYSCKLFNMYENRESLYISFVSTEVENEVSVQKLNLIEIQSAEVGTATIVNTNTLATISSDVIIDAICLNKENTYIVTHINPSKTCTISKYNNTNTLVSTIKTSESYIEIDNMEYLETDDGNYFVAVTNDKHNIAVFKESIYTSSDNSSIPYFAYVASKITGGVQSDKSFLKGELTTITDIKCFNGKLYIADRENKNIQEYVLEEGDIPDSKKLTAKEITLCHNSYEDGYTYSANDFTYLNENNIFISDTLNNRLQNINEVITSKNKVSDEIDLANPKFYSTNNKYVYWVYTSNGTNNNIIKISDETTTTIPTPNVTDMKIRYDNTLYYIDSINKKLNYIKENSITVETALSDLDINESSKIVTLNNNTIVITKDNMISLYTFESNIAVSTLILQNNIISIDKDYYNNLYVLTEDEIIRVDNIDNTLTQVDKFSFDTTGINCIQVDKINGDIIAYDSINYRFLRIKSPMITSLENFEHIENTKDYVAKTNIMSSGVVSQTYYIYNYPYSTDITFELEVDTKIYILGEVENFYYIIYNDNNTLHYGYLKKDMIDVTTYDIEQISKVRVINKNIRLYTIPSILKDVDNTFYYGTTATLNTVLNVVNFNLNSIDKSTYFAVIDEEGFIYYVNSSDVTLDSVVEILPLPDLNAQIISHDNIKVKLYIEEDFDSEVIELLLNKRKLYVADFDPNKKLTYITIITADRKAVSGYVETKYIRLIENNPNMLSAYILLGIAVLVIIVSTITYLFTKKDVIK